MDTQPKFFVYCIEDRSAIDGIKSAFNKDSDVIVEIQMGSQEVSRIIQRIRDVDACEIFLFISDRYLKSESCMFGSLEFVSDAVVKDKLSMILLSDSNDHTPALDCGFNDEVKQYYQSYWDQQYLHLRERKEIITETEADNYNWRVRIFRNINNQVDPLIEEMKKIRCVSSEELKRMSVSSKADGNIEEGYQASISDPKAAGGEVIDEIFEMVKAANSKNGSGSKSSDQPDTSSGKSDTSIQKTRTDNKTESQQKKKEKKSSLTDKSRKGTSKNKTKSGSSSTKKDDQKAKKKDANVITSKSITGEKKKEQSKKKKKVSKKEQPRKKEKARTKEKSSKKKKARKKEKVSKKKKSGKKPKARKKQKSKKKKKSKNGEKSRKKHKAVLITGATSGIGKETAKVFGKNGRNLILTGRRKGRLKKLRSRLKNKYGIAVKILNFDIRKLDEVQSAVKALKGNWKKIDVLVNNAGLASGFDYIQDGNIEQWEKMIDTNLKGLLYITRYVSPWMVKNKKGHIINIGSVAGTQVYPRGNVYCATKHAVDALTRSMRLDLHKHNIKVSSVSPGHVETEFALVRFDGNKKKARMYEDFQPLNPTDVAKVIYFIASQPKHVNIQDVLMFGTQQASANHIHRSGKRK